MRIMATSIFLRPVVILAGGLGVFQSIIWLAMCITAICAYFCIFESPSKTDKLGQLLHAEYFLGHDCSHNAIIANLGNWAKTINIWVWLYLVFSTFWLVSSICLLKDVTIKQLKYANYYLYVWIFLTFSVCIMDFALGIVMALHYHEVSSTNVISQSAAGVLMTIAFRGFTLWILNLCCAVFLTICTLAIAEQNKITRNDENLGYVLPHSIHRERPIDAFSPSPIIAKKPPWSINSPKSVRVPPWETAQRSKARPIESGPANRLASKSSFIESEPYLTVNRSGYDADIEIRRPAANRLRGESYPPRINSNISVMVPPSYPDIPPVSEPRPDYSPVLKPALRKTPSRYK